MRIVGSVLCEGGSVDVDHAMSYWTTRGCCWLAAGGEILSAARNSACLDSSDNRGTPLLVSTRFARVCDPTVHTERKE
jgi:hypothetical protein